MLRIIQKPSLEHLVAFEEKAWPEHVRAKKSELAHRLNAYPAGIFLLEDDGEAVAQMTFCPKSYSRTNITSFQTMRDLPVDLHSKKLWGINVAALPGRRYAYPVVEHGLRWAAGQGFEQVASVITCPGYAKHLACGKVSSIEDYMAQGLNPAMNVFAHVTRENRWHMEVEPPIADYWKEDKESAGYGILFTLRFSTP